MPKLILIFCLFLSLAYSYYLAGSTTERYPMRYIRVHWLANIGKVFSSSYDTVKFSATADTPVQAIVCGTGGEAIINGEERPDGI